MRKYFLIIFLIFIFFGFINSVFAYKTIVTDYPELPACQGNVKCKPGQDIFTMQAFIKYIYIFAIGIVGIIGLLAIILAAFGYVTSAGNPQQASDAKGKIISALLGMLLLLGSVVLLRMINPDLLTLKLEVEEVKISTDVDKCKKECAAAGPPSPACLQKCEESSETECRPVSVKWEKSTINVKESVYLIYKLNKFCKEDAEIAFCGDSQGSFLRQDRPFGTGCALGAGTGWDPYCQKIYYKGGLNRAHDTDGSILLKYPYTFEGQCKDKSGISECPRIPVPILCPNGDMFTGTICNFKISAPEIFYAEGQCEMNTGEVFYPAGKVPITVKDGQ